MGTKKEELDKKIQDIELQIEDAVKEITKIIGVEYSDELKHQFGRLITYTNIQFEYTKEKYAGVLARYWPKESNE